MNMFETLSTHLWMSFRALSRSGSEGNSTRSARVSRVCSLPLGTVMVMLTAAPALAQQTDDAKLTASDAGA